MCKGILFRPFFATKYCANSLVRLRKYNFISGFWIRYSVEEQISVGAIDSSVQRMRFSYHFFVFVCLSIVRMGGWKTRPLTLMVTLVFSTKLSITTINMSLSTYTHNILDLCLAYTWVVDPVLVLVTLILYFYNQGLAILRFQSRDRDWYSGNPGLMVETDTETFSIQVSMSRSRLRL